MPWKMCAVVGAVAVGVAVVVVVVSVIVAVVSIMYERVLGQGPLFQVNHIFVSVVMRV